MFTETKKVQLDYSKQSQVFLQELSVALLYGRLQTQAACALMFLC